MKIGLVGSGGREHALAKALSRNPRQDTLFVYAGSANPGIARLTPQVTVGSLSDATAIRDFFALHQADLVVIGPEAPLMHGVIDGLRKQGIPAIGPTQAQAQLEGSKAFMRDLLLRRVGWGSPAWKIVKSRAEARAFIEQTGEVAVKPIGLTGGKGVRVMGVHLNGLEEAVEDAAGWIQKDGSVLLEERLIGEEFSRMVFVSDGQLAPMPVAQDFKYAYDGDQGNMTGGMGAYTMANGSMPFLRPEDLAEADRLMNEVVAALEAESGEPYRGFLYGQFMVTAKGVRVIEFNVRLGDPEGINEMTLLQSPAPEFLLGVAQGKMDRSAVSFAPVSSVVKYLVPADYPENGPEPIAFQFDEKRVAQADLQVIYASVKSTNGHLETLGSRTLAVIGTGATPGEVSERIEKLLAEIQPSTLRHRKDVGDPAALQRKIDRMAHLREGGNR